MIGGVTDTDVHISLDDQKMINKFARQNQKLEEITDEMKARILFCKLSRDYNSNFRQHLLK